MAAIDPTREQLRNAGVFIVDGIEFIRKDALLEFVNKKLQESADRLDFRTNRAYAEVIDHINEM